MTLYERYQAWRVRREIRKMERMCAWVEGYMRRKHFPRQYRKRIYSGFGKLAFRIAVARQQQTGNVKIKRGDTPCGQSA